MLSSRQRLFNAASQLTGRSVIGQQQRQFSVLSDFATVDPKAISGTNPAKLENCVNGKWCGSAKTSVVIDPMNGEPFIISPDTQVSHLYTSYTFYAFYTSYISALLTIFGIFHHQSNELQPFMDSMKNVPKTGTHNIYKSPEKYVL